MIQMSGERIEKLFLSILVPRISTRTYYLRVRLNYNRQDEGIKADILTTAGLAKIKMSTTYPRQAWKISLL